MEITVDERTQRAVDTAMRYFLQAHRNGTAQDTETVCAYVQKVLYDRNIEVSYEYVEARWHELLSRGPEPKAEPKRMLSDRRQKTKDDWNGVRLQVFNYMRSLPPVEPLDKEAAAQAVEDSMTVISAFKYNNRAVENLMKKEEKRKVRKLEDAGLVKPRNVTLKIKDKDKKTGKDYTVHYWEPAAGTPLERPPEEPQNKCLQDEEELNRLDMDVADGADIYLKDEAWGAKNDKK